MGQKTVSKSCDVTLIAWIPLTLRIYRRIIQPTPRLTSPSSFQEQLFERKRREVGVCEAGTHTHGSSPRGGATLFAC